LSELTRDCAASVRSHLRIMLSPAIEAPFLAHAIDRITNPRSLSRDIGVAFAVNALKVES
jgi:hypothetical protein